MRNLRNEYRCDKCGVVISTFDFDAGTTPFMLKCKAKDAGKTTEECDGVMYSACYRVPQSQQADYEWFRPADLAGYDDAMRDHIERGGLDLRKRIRGGE